jgi:hypothetical protein
MKIPLILSLLFTASLFDIDRGMNKLVIKQGPCSGFGSLLYSKAITIEISRGNRTSRSGE